MRAKKLTIVWLLCFIGVGASASAQSRVPERIAIPFGTNRELTLSLLHVPPAKTGAERAVLFLHGATFPSSMAAGYAFDKYSWMDDLSAAGLDVWALDFLGYGQSSRYPEMAQTASANPPLGRAPIAAEQVHAAVQFILKRRKLRKLSLVAHSWGTIAAGVYATSYPETVDRLVLFGPVAQRAGATITSTDSPAWECVTEQDQINRFTHYVPKGEAQVFEPSALRLWAAEYMHTDAHSGERTPACVRVQAPTCKTLGMVAWPTIPPESRLQLSLSVENGTWLLRMTMLFGYSNDFRPRH